MGFRYLLGTGALNRWAERVCRWRTTAPSLQGPAFKQGHLLGSLTLADHWVP